MPIEFEGKVVPFLLSQQLADAIGVSKSTLLRWLDQNPQLEPERDRNIRHFSDSAIIEIFRHMATITSGSPNHSLLPMYPDTEKLDLEAKIIAYRRLVITQP